MKQRETERECESEKERNSNREIFSSFTSQIVSIMADRYETTLREVEEDLEYALKVEQRRVFRLRIEEKSKLR